VYICHGSWSQVADIIYALVSTTAVLKHSTCLTKCMWGCCEALQQSLLLVNVASDCLILNFKLLCCVMYRLYMVTALGLLLALKALYALWDTLATTWRSTVALSICSCIQLIQLWWAIRSPQHTKQHSHYLSLVKSHTYMVVNTAVISHSLHWHVRLIASYVVQSGIEYIG
jgi:hypothetical protein